MTCIILNRLSHMSLYGRSCLASRFLSMSKWLLSCCDEDKNLHRSSISRLTSLPLIIALSSIIFFSITFLVVHPLLVFRLDAFHLRNPWIKSSTTTWHQIYLKLSRIQILSQVDAILVYACDEETLRSIIDAGHHFNLFNLHPVSSWVLLNPFRHRRDDTATQHTMNNYESTTQNIDRLNENSNDNLATEGPISLSTETLNVLPSGILSLVQQPLPLLDSPAIHYAIINLISSAANKTLEDFLSMNEASTGKIVGDTAFSSKKTSSQSYLLEKINVSCWTSYSASSSSSSIIHDYRQLSSLLFK